MTVRDYVDDMLLGQKWAVHVDFYDKQNEWVSMDTFHFSIPHTKCIWLDSEVKYFRIIKDEIVLCISKNQEKL